MLLTKVAAGNISITANRSKGRVSNLSGWQPQTMIEIWIPSLEVYRKVLYNFKIGFEISST